MPNICQGADLASLAVIAYAVSAMDGGVGRGPFFWGILRSFFSRNQYTQLPGSFSSRPLANWFPHEAGSVCEYYHGFQCFSGEPRLRRRDIRFTGVISERASGSVQTLGRLTYFFRENRKTIYGSYFLPNGSEHPVFSIVVLDDGGEAEDIVEKYIGWEERGFVVAGENAAHHFLQVVIFGALNEWRLQWQNTLDGLELLVSVDVSTSRAGGWPGIPVLTLHTTSSPILRTMTRRKG